MSKPATRKANETVAGDSGWVERLGALTPAEMDALRESLEADPEAAVRAVTALRACIDALAGTDEKTLQGAWLAGVEAAYVLSSRVPGSDEDIVSDPTPVRQAFLAGLRGRAMRTMLAEVMPLPGEPEGSALTRGLRGAARRMRRGKK